MSAGIRKGIESGQLVLPLRGWCDLLGRAVITGIRKGIERHSRLTYTLFPTHQTGIRKGIESSLSLSLSS